MNHATPPERRAGVPDQRDVHERERLLPRVGFETNVANNYGEVLVRQDGGCSHSPDTGPYWDFQIPCKAHDFCYDARAERDSQAPWLMTPVTTRSIS